MRIEENFSNYYQFSTVEKSNLFHKNLIQNPLKVLRSIQWHIINQSWRWITMRTVFTILYLRTSSFASYPDIMESFRQAFTFCCFNRFFLSDIQIDSAFECRNFHDFTPFHNSSSSFCIPKQSDSTFFSLSPLTGLIGSDYENEQEARGRKKSWWRQTRKHVQFSPKKERKWNCLKLFSLY